MIRLYAHFSILLLTTAYYAKKTPSLPPHQKKKVCIKRSIDAVSVGVTWVGKNMDARMMHLLGKINEPTSDILYKRINQVKFSVILCSIYFKSFYKR